MKFATIPSRRQPTFLTPTLALLAVLTALSGCQPQEGEQQPTNPEPEITATGQSTTGQPATGQPAMSVDSVGEDLLPPAGGETFVPGVPFEGWESPQVVLVLSGEQDGYIEPCGCSGLENKKGGLNRRWTFLQELQSRGWDYLAFDVGGQVKRTGRQAEIKFEKTITGLNMMQYAGIAFGRKDLRLPSGAWLEKLVDGQTPFVAANVGPLGFEAELTPTFRVHEKNGVRVGVTAILGERYQALVNNSDVAFRPMATALREVLPQMQQQADVLVLLSHATMEESRALAAEFPQFQVVVSAGGAQEPPYLPHRVGETYLIEVGHKAMHVVALGLFADGWKFQKVSLDNKYPENETMLQLLAEYQDQLQVQGFDGLGIQSLPDTPGRTFVGSETCGECHTTAFEIWEKTPHAHALDTLVKLNPQRHFDAECLSCHVTGWEPQQYVPFESGYHDLTAHAHLGQNGCENCHGPGSRHVAIEYGDLEVDEAGEQQAREQMRLTFEAAEKRCVECHDIDNSPKFDFAKYWEEVKHYGVD